MNNSRRKELKKLHSELEEIRERLQAVCEQEQEAYDNLPEGIQASERGESMDEATNNMELSADAIGEAIYYLEEAAQ